MQFRKTGHEISEGNAVAVGKSTLLTPREVVELTARQRWTWQCKMLAQMRIPFLPNAVGRPLVERAMVLKGEATAPARKRAEPHWDAIPRSRRRAVNLVD